MPLWDRYSDRNGMTDIQKKKWVYQPEPERVSYRKAAPPQEELYCHDCCEMRPWYAGEQCNRCLFEGPPTPDPTSALTGVQVRIMEALCEGHDKRAAARLAHVTIEEVESMLEGRDSGAFRRAWQLLLEHNGITLPTLAAKAREALDATDPKWNSESREFELYPDNKTRLNAVKWAVNQHDLDPPKTEGPTAQAGVVVQFVTNLGQESTKQTSNADYSFEVKPLSSEPE